MEQPNYGYIYIRSHPSYDTYNAYKMGKANNIPERDTQYATGEITRGYFEVAFEIPNEPIGKDKVERLLQNEFFEFNIYHNAGTEFYDKQIIVMIEPYLIKHDIKYKKISKTEIEKLTRINRECTPHGKGVQYHIRTIKKIKKKHKYVPRDYQENIISESFEYFQHHDKGILALTCGVGKTLISLWISQKLHSNTILIGVPNILLLSQWKNTICDLFKDVQCLVVSDDVGCDDVIEILEDNLKKCIVLTTYSSSHKVKQATQQLSFTFDMKINDEVHHLTSTNIQEEERKTYVQMLKIKSKKQLSLTATLKILENQRNENSIVSNDNTEYFGEIIVNKSLLWAIEKNIICDYNIQSIITDEEKIVSNFNIEDENDIRLLLSAYVSLKSIHEKHSHHLLIYSNSKTSSVKLITYIKKLLDKGYFEIPDLYYSKYHSEMKSTDQEKIIHNFEKHKVGIITCVYCLGEGWDFPLLDGVVFAENMTSNIRIVQSALRASRKDKDRPDKITKIILPILTMNSEEWIESHNNPDLKKVKQVIYQMGVEDETITHKIKAYRIDFKKQKVRTKVRTKEWTNINEFDELDDEITQKLRLKTIKRITLGSSYEKARKIISDKNIKSKESYYELCEKDVRLPKEPEIFFKGKFTNWIEYLSIERVYYDLETCKQKVKEYLILNPELKQYDLDISQVVNELVKIDKSFPPSGLWTEYYNIPDLRYIIIISKKKKKMSDIV